MLFLNYLIFLIIKVTGLLSLISKQDKFITETGLPVN